MHLAKGVMLFSVILLIGAGFGFIKHALSKNERMVFLIVIPLQVTPIPSPPVAPVPPPPPHGDLLHFLDLLYESLRSVSRDANDNMFARIF